MSLYNLLHGQNVAAPLLLSILGLTPSSVPRYRDCWWTGTEIAIYTRTGGGNRDFYENIDSARANYPEYFEGKDDPKGPWNDDLRALNTFVRDEDDDYDCTYATFYFRVPETLSWVIPHLTAETQTPSDKWESVFAKLNAPDAKSDPAIQKMLNVFEPIIRKINEDLKS